jgi:phosphate-selective porin OprO and OprP
MNIKLMRGVLLASAMLAIPATAFAQEAEPPANAMSPDDPSLQSVSAAELNVSEGDAKMALLQAQLEALQGQIDDMKKKQDKAAPSWKGAPQFAGDGFNFKVRGRFMMDGAYSGTPENILTRNLGFNTRVRRVRLGVEGGLPGGFGYKAEMDFANGAVGFADVVLSYSPANTPLTFTLGNQESLDGMEQLTSSRWSSFIERAQANDAFGNNRRLGLVIGAKSKDGMLRADVGAFASHSIDASLDNKGWIGAARVSYTPYVGPGFVHLGANLQYRDFQSNAGATALATTVGSPSAGKLARYRARPFLQTTDFRYVDTGNFAAKSDLILGGELYGVFKSLHVGGEVQYTKVDAYKSGDKLAGLDAFSTNTQLVPSGNPSFFSGFAEVGYFLTGETRGYKNGLWDRTKVLKPLGKGGMGAVQIIGRFDYLNLNSSKLQNGFSNNFTSGVATASNSLSRGGKQLGYLAGVTWIPTDYVRFLLNYIHTDVTGGPQAATVKPLSTDPVNKRSFSTDAVALRAQFDF